MAITARKIECCGAGFERDDVSLFGLMTFSLPYLLIYSLTFPVIFGLAAMFPALKKPARALSVIFKANLKLIQNADLLPKVKCSLSSRFMGSSPMLAGVVFRYFNLSVLSSVFLGLVGVLITGRALWHRFL